MNGHLLALLLAHRATHEVGFAKCITGKLLRELHYLLLVDDDPVGVVQNLLHLRHEVTHGFLAVVALDELIDHATIEWSRTVECVERGEVFKALRLQLPADLLHARRLKLEDRLSPSLSEYCKRFSVVKRYIRPLNLFTKQL